MAGRKAKFRVGQVVCILGIERIGDPDEYAIVEGFDDGRWHVRNGSRDMKVLPEILRPLTARERGRKGSK